MTVNVHSLQRHSKHLLLRGSLVIVLPLLAIAAPDKFFFNALLGVSAVSIAFGYYETTIGVGRDPGTPRYDFLPLLSGLVSEGH